MPKFIKFSFWNSKYKCSCVHAVSLSISMWLDKNLVDRLTRNGHRMQSLWVVDNNSYVTHAVDDVLLYVTLTCRLCYRHRTIFIIMMDVSFYRGRAVGQRHICSVDRCFLKYVMKYACSIKTTITAYWFDSQSVLTPEP